MDGSKRIWGLAASVLLLASLPTQAASGETPEAFVRRVYTLYRANGAGVSTQRPEGTPFYAAALLDAFAKEEELVHGEVGAIDADPICSCQDHGTIRVKRVTVAPGKGDTVTARADIKNLGANDTIVFTLSPTPAGWRIADIGNEEMKSVMAVLQDAIAHPIQEDLPRGATPPPPKP